MQFSVGSLLLTWSITAWYIWYRRSASQMYWYWFRILMYWIDISRVSNSLVESAKMISSTLTLVVCAVGGFEICILSSKSCSSIGSFPNGMKSGTSSYQQMKKSQISALWQSERCFAYEFGNLTWQQKNEWVAAWKKNLNNMFNSHQSCERQALNSGSYFVGFRILRGLIFYLNFVLAFLQVLVILFGIGLVVARTVIIWVFWFFNFDYDFDYDFWLWFVMKRLARERRRF